MDYAAWATAIGTLALAGVTYYATKASLKIATQDSTVSVKIDAAMFMPMNVDIDELEKKHALDDNLIVSITLTNECKKAVRVSQVYWTFDDRMVRHRWYAVSSTGTISTSISSIGDIKLSPFDNHAEHCRLSQFFAVVDKELSELNGVVDLIKINVMLTDGQKFSSVVDGDFATRLREHIAYIHRVNQGLNA